LRNLLIRGLIERGDGVEGERGYSYKPTSETLAFMGISKIEMLPEYEQVLKEIEDFSRKEDATEEVMKEEQGQ
jgi:chromosome segregation and condensation protein ScpB